MAGSMIGMVGTIVSSEMNRHAQNKAYKIIKQSVEKQTSLDTGTAKAEAKQADLDRFKGSIAAQKKYDPLLAQLRETGASALADILQDDLHKNQEDSVLAQMVKENVPADTKRNAVRDLLLDKAKENLDLGATLSPEYEAELVRAGLSTGSGVRPTAEGPVGVRMRELIGVQGEALKQQRQATAQSELGLVTNMDSARAQILGNLTSSLVQVQNARADRAGLASRLGETAMPGIGLAGGDVVNLHLKQIQMKNRQMMALANAAAGNKLMNAETTGKEIGAATNFLGNAIGGMGGGGSGGTPNLSNSDLTYYKSQFSNPGQ